MSQKKKTASFSGAIQQADSKWHSIAIEWCLPNGKKTDLAFSGFVFPAGFDPKPYVNADSLRAIGDDGLPRPLPAFQEIRGARKRKYFETLGGSKIEIPQYVAEADNTATANVREAIARLQMAQRRMTRNSTGVMCTEVRQWVSVEIECKASQPNSPAVHLWAFLQPANIGGNTQVLAGDQVAVLDDFPRSGWGEYRIAEGGATCMRRTWADGVLKEESVPGNCLKVERKSERVFVFHLRLSIRNDVTPGDLARRKKQKGPARPLDDYEAGCWLKVWVRDPGVAWGMDPADDEANTLVERMDQMDPTKIEYSWSTNSMATLGAHAFLRSRLMYDPKEKGDLAEARPIYAMVFSPEAMDNIVELDKILHPKDKSASMQVASIVTVSSVTLLIAYGLRRALETWQKSTPAAPPAKAPAGVSWPDWANKEKAEFFVKMLESFDVAALLAAYAADGFANASPVEVVASTGSSDPQLVKILAAIYGQIFDMAFAQSPLHYKEFMLKRLEARAQALEERIKWSKKGVANRATEAQEKKAREKSLEDFRKQKGLGLFSTSSRAKFSIDKDGFNFKFMLVEGSKKSSFPKPAGAPLPIAAVPLVWRLDLSASGELGFETRAVPGKDGDSLDLHFDIVGKGEASAAFGIHALWSGLEDPDVLAHAPSLEADWKRKTGRSTTTAKQDKQSDKDEYYANKKALRDLRESAVATPPDPTFQLFRLLKELNQAVRLDAVVTAGLKLEAGIGVKISLNSTTGERKISFKGNGAKGFSASLKADMAAQLQASLLSVDYPIATLPEMGSLSVSAISANLGGTLLGKSFPGKQWSHKWGKGTLNEEIEQENGKEFLVWGRPTPYRLTYKEMESPDVSFDLLRAPNSADPVVGEIPKGAVSCEQKGTGGALKINLQLSCRAEANQPHLVAVGGWSLSEGVGKAAGRNVGSKATPARTFLEELTRSEASAIIIVHAKDLVPTHVYSKSITVFSPRVVDQILLAKPGVLMVTLTLGYFEDDQLWVQLREFNSILADPILPNQGKPWLPFPLQAIKTTDKGRQGVLQIPLNKLTFPRAKEDVWEVYPVLSLVPHDCGIINKKWFPQSDNDVGGYVRVRN